MRRAIRFLKVLLGLFVVAACVLAVWQWNNIHSLITAVRYSEEELAEKIENNKKYEENEVAAYTGGPVRGLSHEEEEQIRKGEITAEQALEKISNKSIAEIENEQAQPAQDANSLINASIEKLYFLKAKYIGRLGELERRAISDYKALSKSQRGIKAQKNIISSYLGEAAALERECDAAVSDILKSLEANLKAINADTKIVNTIKKSYGEEKMLKKSYYFNLYK